MGATLDPGRLMALVEQGRPDRARALLEEGVGHGVGDAEAAAAFRSLDHASRASAGLRSGRVDELASGALAALDAAPAAIPAVVFVAASLLQATYRFTGEARFRRLAVDTCERVADRVDLPDLAVRARALLGNIHMMQGALHRAFDHCEAALSLAAATAVDATPAAAMAHQFRGYVLFEWNRLDVAEEALRRAWKLAGTPVSGVRSGVARIMARVRAAAGDREGADAWLARLEDVVAEPMTLRNREWLMAVRMRHTLGSGDLTAVEGWLRTYDYRPETVAGMEPRERLARLHELDQVLGLLEATDRWTAIVAVAPLVVAAARTERRWFAARAASAEAVALEALGRSDDADARLTDALALGEEGSFVRVYVEGSRLRRRLLQRAADGEGPAREAARRVLGAAGATATPILTPAQHAVLERVAVGGSNKTVARELGVSVNTVRAHLRAVFARLSVTSRTEAVARARERGWV